MCAGSAETRDAVGDEDDAWSTVRLRDKRTGEVVETLRVRKGTEVSAIGAACAKQKNLRTLRDVGRVLPPSSRDAAAKANSRTRLSRLGSADSSRWRVAVAVAVIVAAIGGVEARARRLDGAAPPLVVDSSADASYWTTAAVADDASFSNELAASAEDEEALADVRLELARLREMIAILDAKLPPDHPPLRRAAFEVVRHTVLLATTLALSTASRGFAAPVAAIARLRRPFFPLLMKEPPSPARRYNDT